ncbi:MAG TPA: Clp protease N-terminal domain-containing protein, partial [Chitinophagales bacterium]|nr:Clp protease N-terminal domain-containing protein [Chitinophagales bacterium]
MMNPNNLTIKSQEAIQKAQELAFANQNQSIETGHLLKGLLLVDENVVDFLLKKLGVNTGHLESRLDEQLNKYPKVSGGSGQYLSGDGNQVLLKAQSYLKEYKDEFVSVEHLLLALLSGKDETSKLLKDAGVGEKDLKLAIAELRKGRKVTDQSAESTYNALNKYAKNLHSLAQSGKLDPVIGR